MENLQPEIDFGPEINTLNERLDFKKEQFPESYEVSEQELVDVAKVLEINNLTSRDIIEREEIGPFSVEQTQNKIEIKADKNDVSECAVLKEIIEAIRKKTDLGKPWTQRYEEISRELRY